MGGMTLLGRPVLVLFEPLVDDGPERVQNRAAPGDFQLVPGWARVTEKLPNGAAVMVSFPSNAPDAFAVDEVGSSNLFSLVHCEHSCPPVIKLAKTLASLPEICLRWVCFRSSHHI